MCSKFVVRFGIIIALMWLQMAGVAFAEGFALYEYSARGIALGGAVTARKPDPSAVAYNPALLTKLEGTHIVMGVSTISPAGEMKGTDTSGNKFRVTLKDSVWPVPHFYFTHKLNDRIALGIGEFSRFGLGFEYPHDWAGRENIYQVNLQSASINPNIAVAVTDSLSLAGGLEMVYVNLDLKKRGRYALPGMPMKMEVDHNVVDANDVGVGFNLAGHYQFNDEWAAGLVYRSQVRVTAHGEMQNSFVNRDEFASRLPAPVMAQVDAGYSARFHDGMARGRVVLPDSVAGGVSWTPREDLSIEAGAIWTRWSTFKKLDIHLPRQNTVSKTPKDWDDAWRFNIGVEYDPLDWLTLRAGYVHDRSPMTNKYADYLIPTNGRNIYSAGVGVHWDSWTVDASYAFINAVGRRYSSMYLGRGADGQDRYASQRSKVTRSVTDIFSLSIGYQF